MKLDNRKDFLTQDEIENVNETPVKKELEFVKRLFPKRGHKLFKINKETLEVSEDILYSDDSVVIFDPNWKKGDKIKTKGKVIIEDDYHYVTALNKKNALKKIQKIYEI